MRSDERSREFVRWRKGHVPRRRRVRPPFHNRAKPGDLTLWPIERRPPFFLSVRVRRCWPYLPRRIESRDIAFLCSRSDMAIRESGTRTVEDRASLHIPTALADCCVRSAAGRPDRHRRNRIARLEKDPDAV